MAAETKKVLNDLYKKYNITDKSIKPAVKSVAKPTIGTKIKSVVETVKSALRPKTEKKVSLPSGVRTSSDKKMVLGILGITKKNKNAVAKPGK